MNSFGKELTSAAVAAIMVELMRPAWEPAVKIVPRAFTVLVQWGGTFIELAALLF